MKILSSYLFIYLLASSCVETYYFINIKNNSNHQICFFKAFPYSYFNVYPDTILHKKESDFPKIEASHSQNIGGTRSWESKFEEIPSDTLSFYFFHPDTLAKYPWETIRKDYNILKRYDLSIQDIQLLDYEIVYPPTEAMEKMKMYPPYEE